ncbi:MAG: hypothetical protein ABIZ04_07910 [Opitutus sp.]
MLTPICFEDAQDLQLRLSARQLSGTCISAGRFVVVELNVPPRTSMSQLAQTLGDAGPLSGATLQHLSSSVGQYPDGHLRMDFRFASREDASKFLTLAKGQMCCP